MSASVSQTSFDLVPVVLCGGSGTRLWPLSRKSLPKQFVPLVQGRSLLEWTLRRASRLAPQCMVVASEEHRFLVQECVEAAQGRATVLLEPLARNTAAAMVWAALNAAPQSLLLFLPADHHIPDAEGFAAAVQRGCAAASQGQMVTFGVQPSFPSTAYGYIERRAASEVTDVYAVQRFVEKPDAARAQQLLLQGNYLWNAGIFLCRADTLLQGMEKHAPDILAQCRAAWETQSRDGDFVRLLTEAFAACRSESIDYALMEPLAATPGTVAVVPFVGAWSDVGSWNAVAQLCESDAQGNRIYGQGVVVQARNTYVHAPHRPVVALGTQDLLVIDTADALLVADAAHAEAVKQVVTRLEADGVPQAQHHRRVARPWGSYDSVDAGERFQVKRIVVKPGAALSLQKHHHRAEHWIVVRGTAQVTNGEQTLLLTENQSTYIPVGQVHRLANPGKVPLEIIEVQSGAYLGEDDIVRLDDVYGR